MEKIGYRYYQKQDPEQIEDEEAKEGYIRHEWLVGYYNKVPFLTLTNLLVGLYQIYKVSLLSKVRLNHEFKTRANKEQEESKNKRRNEKGEEAPKMTTEMRTKEIEKVYETPEKLNYLQKT